MRQMLIRNKVACAVGVSFILLIGTTATLFENYRYAEILVGHHGQQALINHWAATKDFEVYSADIGTRENRRI
jgi:hypothetical protein